MRMVDYLGTLGYSAESLGFDQTLRPCDLFNNISVMSGQWVGDNERLCAMQPRLRLERSPLQAELEPVAARLAGPLTYRAP